MGSVYSTLFLGFLKPGKLHTGKNETTVDAFEYVYTCRWCARERVLSDCQHIQREASVVRSTVVGNAKASESGTGLKVQALRFSFFNIMPMRQARRQFVKIMRIRILIICLLFCIASVCAKDIITKTDGTKIDAKVEEITESVIRYRKASNPTGPIYSIPIGAVYNIVYENGEVEKFNEPSAPVTPVQNPSYIPCDDDLIRMSENQVTEITSKSVSDAQLLSIEKYSSDILLEKKANQYRIIGWVGGGVLLLAGIATGIGKSHYDNNNENGSSGTPVAIVAGGAIAGAAWCLGFNLKANSLIKEAEKQSYSATIIENEILHFGNKSLTAGINLMGNRIVNTHGVGLSIGLNF